MQIVRMKRDRDGDGTASGEAITAREAALRVSPHDLNDNDVTASGKRSFTGVE